MHFAALLTVFLIRPTEKLGIYFTVCVFLVLATSKRPLIFHITHVLKLLFRTWGL